MPSTMPRLAISTHWSAALRLCLLQTSFKDVKCINAGAIPFPKHGRQIEVDESQIHDAEVRDMTRSFLSPRSHILSFSCAASITGSLTMSHNQCLHLMVRTA